MATDISAFLSTYGVMTAERILERYALSLSHQEILVALKNPSSFYYQLLRIPFKNVLNGIIIQQAHDYQVFAQKLFIDYLMTGESGKDVMEPGGTSRESLEEERQHLVSYSKSFEELKTEHEKLIAESQTFLIDYAVSIRSVKMHALQQSSKIYTENNALKILENAVNQSLIYKNFVDFSKNFAEILGMPGNQKMIEAWEEMDSLLRNLDLHSEVFMERARDISRQVSSMRKQFYELILRVRALILLLPEYKHDQALESKNRETLYFDSSIGEV